MWNLKEEAINYCLIDCIVLYEVLILFNSLIYKRFKVNIKRFATLPSLSFGIFRSKFIKGHIPIILGDVYKFIQQSYTGGAVDVYFPNALKENKEMVHAHFLPALAGYNIMPSEASSTEGRLQHCTVACFASVPPCG